MPPLSAITSAAFSARSNSRTSVVRTSASRSPGSGSAGSGSAVSGSAVSGSAVSRGAARKADAASLPAQPVEKPESQAEVPVEPAAAAQPAVAAPKKLRRSRVPGNLAQMYGESTAKRDVQAAPAAPEEKKARRDPKARELRKAVMQVDETLLQRLAQPAASALIVGEEAEAPVRRGRTWQAACGKCGTRSTFRTPGALCPVCEAICLRDAI